jgi:hypothetical protein
MPLARLASDDLSASGLRETLTGPLMCFEFHQEIPLVDGLLRHRSTFWRDNHD